MGQLACEAAFEAVFDGLLGVVDEPFACAPVLALIAVEQIGCLEPQVAHLLYVYFVLVVVEFQCESAAVGSGIANLREADSSLFEQFLHLLLVLFGHFNHHAGVLCEQRLGYIAVGTQVVQVDVQTALGVGEAHFEQRSDESAGRNVVSGHDKATVHQFLNGVERIAEVLRVLHSRHVVAHFSEALREGTASKALLIEREVDVEQ